MDSFLSTSFIEGYPLLSQFPNRQLTFVH